MPKKSYGVMARVDVTRLQFPLCAMTTSRNLKPMCAYWKGIHIYVFEFKPSERVPCHLHLT